MKCLSLHQLKTAWAPGQLMDKVLPLGAIVAVADLVACVPTITNSRFVACDKGGYLETDLGNWGSGRWAWGLENIQPLLEALPFPGRQGLFTIPPATLAGRPLLGPLGWTVPGSEHSLIVRKMLEKQAQNDRILSRR